MLHTPLTLLTMFHPDYWLGVKAEELWKLPHIRRDRKKIEENRKEHAAKHNLEITTTQFHDRPITNLGNSIDRLRRTSLDDLDGITRCVSDMKMRLLIYDEQGSQSRFRFECRYDWGSDANSLDDTIIRKVCDRILDDKKVSVRQLWINKKSARFGILPLPKVLEDEPLNANLVVGPIEKKDTLRPSKITILRQEGVWWLRY